MAIKKKSSFFNHNLIGFLGFVSVCSIPFVYQEFNEIKQAGKSLSESLVNFVSFLNAADSWNYIAITFLISVLTIHYSLIELILKRKWTGNGYSKIPIALLRQIGIGLIVLLSFIFITNYIIIHYSTPKIIHNIVDIPDKQSVLLLGTKKELAPGIINGYYKERIETVITLYEKGKIKEIIISGDHTGNYDETKDMKIDLVNAGVPKSIIIIDSKGYRTLDSIVRLKQEFKIREILIISQGFHLQRAIFLAWFYNVDASGYYSEGEMNTKMALRETLAKPKLFLDVFILNTQPRYGKSAYRRKWDYTSTDDLILFGLSQIIFFISAVLLIHTIKEKP